MKRLRLVSIIAGVEDHREAGLECAMSMRWMRLGFMSFVVLTAAFTVNLTLLQPLNGRTALRQIPDPPRTASLGSPIATGSLSASGAARRVDISQSITRSGETPDIVRATQRELQARGYETGTADGVPGLITRAAIMAYEADHDLPLTGIASDGLLERILLGASAGSPKRAKGEKAEVGPEAEQVIRTVQGSLSALGYPVAKVSGRLGDETFRAIREFETDQSLPVTGRISGQLVARLARLAGQGKLAEGR
jgi:peptidoglycan hydrolase-like protein with peptidoglycan-binding domain